MVILPRLSYSQLLAYMLRYSSHGHSHPLQNLSEMNIRAAMTTLIEIAGQSPMAFDMWPHGGTVTNILTTSGLIGPTLLGLTLMPLQESQFSTYNHVFLVTWGTPFTNCAMRQFLHKSCWVLNLFS